MLSQTDVRSLIQKAGVHPAQNRPIKRKPPNGAPAIRMTAAALSASLTGTAFLPSVIPLRVPEHLSDSRQEPAFPAFWHT